MDAATRESVRQRANARCEYCQLHEDHDVYVFHVEHIVPKKHRGKSTRENLAYACQHCNLHKGPNLTGRDPDSNAVVELFNPRRQVWAEHFYFNGFRIEGVTDIGRTTVFVLDMNHPDRVAQRAILGS